MQILNIDLQIVYFDKKILKFERNKNLIKSKENAIPL